MFHVKHFLITAFLFPFISFGQFIGNNVLPDIESPAHPLRDSKVDAFIAQFSELSKMPQLNQDWFYWTNYSRDNPRRFYDSVIEPLLICMPKLNSPNARSLKKQLYESLSLPMLRPNKDLMKVAVDFAEEMASKSASPSHNSPSGSTFQSRMESIKIKFCAGENISWGKPNTLLMLALLYIDEGVANLGHRKSLLDPAFTEMGIASNVYSNGIFIVVQDFACSQPR